MTFLENILANLKALSIAIVAGLLTIGFFGSVILERTANQTIRHEAERNAAAWATYVGGQLPDLHEIADGRELRADEKKFLDAMRQFGDVFRFKLFDPAGRLILLSDDLSERVSSSPDLGKHNPKAAGVVATGRPYTEVKDGSNKPNRPDVYAETYVPVVIGGKTEAIVEVYVDQTEQAALVRSDFTIFGLKVIAIVLAAISLPLIALAFAARKLRAQKAELIVERDKAKSGERAKAEFLANMSHEVRTPLNGVLGMTGLILSSDLDSDQRHYAETIQSSGESLLKVLNDILDFSKIDAGKLEIEPCVFGIVPMLDGTVNLLAQNAHAKNLEIPSFVDARIPDKLFGDEGRIRQVLLNLISNAIKFTEEGGVAVEVSVAIAETHSGGMTIRFEVADTGVGIPKDKLDTVFAQFEQADGSTTRQFGGTGLGLAISKSLVQLMGGEIGVQQRPEGGSLFWFTIPFEQVEERECWSQEIARTIDGRQILVVDDNAVNRLVFERQLAALGAVVTTAGSAESALRRIATAADETVPYDLIIIDHMMPGTDGLELAQNVRAMPGGDAVEMVLSSSSGMFNSHASAQKHGFDAALPKPLRPGALIKCMEGLTGREQTAPASRKIGSENISSSNSPGSGPQIRILVAEDNAINQQLLLALLGLSDCKIDTVANGVEAIAALRMLPYDLVLMDVQMPELDGLQATRKIRSLPGENADVPIIGLSAHAMKGDCENAIKAGMNEYLTKPIVKTELFEKIMKWVPRAELSDSGGTDLETRALAS